MGIYAAVSELQAMVQKANIEERKEWKFDTYWQWFQEKFQVDGEDAKARSENLGVCAEYIVDEFEEEAMQAGQEAYNRQKDEYGVKRERGARTLPWHLPPADPRDPNFHNLASVMCYGPSAKGAGTVCPRDGLVDCSFVDALDAERCGKAGKATHFLSWVWSYKAGVFVSAIRAWIEHGRETTSNEPGTVFLWVCFFCNNQFRLQNNADDLEIVFRKRLMAIGQVVALLDTYQEPIYVTRIWCVFEQFTAASLQIPVEIILPPDQADKFHYELENTGMKNIIASLTNIDVETAKASQPEDEKKVKALIEREIGYIAVNNQVQGSMSNWVRKECESFLKKVALRVSMQ